MNTTTLEFVAGHPLVTSIGWTLIHFVWQAAVVAVVSALVLGTMRRSSASIRYIVACVGMTVMTIAPIGTFAWLVSVSSVDDWKANGKVAAMTSPNDDRVEKISSAIGDSTTSKDIAFEAVNRELPSQPTLNEVENPVVRGAVGPWTSNLESFGQAMQRWLPWCVVLWIGGVICLAIRLLAGLRRVWFWRSEGVEVFGGELTDAVSRLSRRMKLRQSARLLETARESVPAVIGWLRPVILVPAGMLSGLTTAEMESILAHELAHIRRHDYPVNLLQTVVETLLFYHPAVWWLSARIRTERENCCDDIAIEVCGNRVAFARALTRLEELRCKHNRLSVAANGGSLVDRIRRIVLAKPHCNESWWPAGAIVLASLAVLASGLLMSVASGDVSGPDVADKDGYAIGEDGTGGADALADANVPEDDEYPVQKPEVERVDAKTGQSHRVMADIKLSVGEQPPVSVDLKYSNLMRYTFIPAGIAKELEAVELGEIDFGEAAPQRAEPQQLMIRSAPLSELVPPPPGAQPADDEAPRPAQKAATEELVFVDDLDRSAGERKIVPYPNDSIWVPDHLAFYGVNQTRQTKFRVVRIDRVELGLGPRFGPVNALVLDDDNTSLGVLGSNWACIPRGSKGESFVHSAVDGFWFMALPRDLQLVTEKSQLTAAFPLQHVSAEQMGKVVRELFAVPQTTSPQDSSAPNVNSPVMVVIDARTNSLVISGSAGQIESISALVKDTDALLKTPTGVGEENEKILATHTYDMSRRESTGWIEVGGSSQPVDDGPEAAGVKVYVTMMMDILAVETATGKILWHHDWGKQNPAWKTASIIELGPDVPEQERLVAEFVSANGATRRRFDLKTGKESVAAAPAALAGEPVRVVRRDGDRITLAAMESQRAGRSPVELLQRHADVLMRSGMPVQGAWVTDHETLVSAENPSMLPAGPDDPTAALDAQEVIFNLPEGSAMRVEFSGENVELGVADSVESVLVTNGRVKLFDSNGVERADASPDGGAEQLVVEVRSVDGERVLKLRTRRIVPDPDFPQPPVQVKCNLVTGEPADEEQPPHGAVRYAFENPNGSEPARMKIRWHYDLQRLVEEAERETGRKWPDLMNDIVPFQTFENPLVPSAPPSTEPARDDSRPRQMMADKGETEAVVADEEWGPLAENSGLQSRLILMTGEPAIGQPLLLKLELRNSRDKPTGVDLQYYAPFRVLRAVCIQPDGKGGFAPFIGMTPQTSGGPQELAPGEVITVWENVDATTLFLLDQEGAYQFFAEGNEWAGSSFKQDSNHLDVLLQPGRLPPQQALISSLLKLETLPKDWEVSSGFGAIYVSHSPTNLKRDVTTIQLWFTEVPLPPDYKLGEGDGRKNVTTIGPCELGQLHLAAPKNALELWPEHVRDIRIAAARALNFNAEPNSPDGSAASPKGNEHALPWRVYGRVTDADNKPIAGATVRSQTGIGSLRLAGEAATDADGKYDLRFGPGLLSENKKMVQAATISVDLDGHFEKNLHRQGDRIAALEKPEGDLGWGGKTLSDLFLPGESKEINFVMLPATKISGMVIGLDGDHLDGVRVSLVGEDMPPSSSVVANTQTDKGGRFELTGIPTGFKYQILVRPLEAKPPWLAWASAPMVYTPHDDGNTHFEYSIDGKPVDFGCQQLTLILNGNGVNWKTALKEAADKKLELTWDGLSNERQVGAGMAFLELGGKDE